MANKKQRIPVQIVLCDYYSDFDRFIGKLGTVSPTQAQQIVDAFSTAKITPNSCIQTMSLQRTDTVQFGCTPFNNQTFSKIDLEALFYFGNRPKCKNCNTKTMTEEQKYKTCYRNFRKGNCIDPNMREIIGKKILPHLYDKQK